MNLKLKNISAIAGLIVGVVLFAIWYKIAYNTYPKVPINATRMVHYGYWISMSLLLFALSENSKIKIRQLIYYAGSNFWMFLSIAYFLNRNFDILIKQNKIIFTIILTIISCIIYYLFSQFRSET